MIINEHAAVITNKILLVPYSEHHVPTYHGWMKDEGIQIATASEPLTLEEEYAMQRSWRKDADKLTFISCLPPSTELLPTFDDVQNMIGDVNLFLLADESFEGEGVAPITGEVELMIAAQNHQGRGYGRASLLAFLRYVSSHEEQILQQYQGEQSQVRFHHLRVKIGQTNNRSIKLFESVGFHKVTTEPTYFGEYELRCESISVDMIDQMLEKYSNGDYRELYYPLIDVKSEKDLGA